MTEEKEYAVVSPEPERHFTETEPHPLYTVHRMPAEQRPGFKRTPAYDDEALYPGQPRPWHTYRWYRRGVALKQVGKRRRASSTSLQLVLASIPEEAHLAEYRWPPAQPPLTPRKRSPYP